ncbi:hypothetical protein IWW34DRAFT_809802 [Fusarium oxysporum f. sp. albedinis]|nr:hypothetical protein IWW34DRAFT_809802 [Fusarium oxysporum f. sp. albedinis]
MEPETVATSFEKDACKTKDNAPKGKTRTFSPKQEHQAPRTSPWLRDYPEEFIRHVELVAHMDARAGKWERLLRDSGERTNLLQAIIFKALDNRVFSRLLFGAGSKHDETLHNSDVALINAEGWLSVGLRMSPAIVSINWLIPGELHALDQVSTCQPAYEASKEAAQQQGMRLQEQRPERKQISSMARVKISVIPEIIRYRPYPKEANVEGIDSYRMMEPHAVHYHGLQEEHDENRAFISLPDYIKKLRDRNCTPRNAALVIMVTILICLWVLYTTSGQQTWQEAKGWVNPEPGPEPEKSWWSLTW